MFEYVAPAPVLAHFLEPSVPVAYMAPALDVTCPVPATEHVAPAFAGTYTEPAPMIEHVSFAPDDTYAAPAPETEHVAPASAVIFATPAPVIKHVSFAPDDTYAAPARIDCMAPATLVKYIAPASPRVNRDIRGSVNPQFSTFAVEASASQVVGSFLAVDESAPPAYKQVHQAQIAAELFVESVKEVPQERLPEISVFCSDVRCSLRGVATSERTLAGDLQGRTRQPRWLRSRQPTAGYKYWAQLSCT